MQSRTNARRFLKRIAQYFFLASARHAAWVRASQILSNRSSQALLIRLRTSAALDLSMAPAGAAAATTNNTAKIKRMEELLRQTDSLLDLALGRRQFCQTGS